MFVTPNAAASAMTAFSFSASTLVMAVARPSRTRSSTLRLASAWATSQKCWAAWRTGSGIRELRRTFTEPGDLAWRATAAEALEEARLDGPSLIKWLSKRVASDLLKPV